MHSVCGIRQNHKYTTNVVTTKKHLKLYVNFNEVTSL